MRTVTTVITLTCDRCKEVTDSGVTVDIRVTVPMAKDGIHPMRTSSGDLCIPCTVELQKRIGRFFERFGQFPVDK